jgi:hypothetical protein
MRMRNRIVAAAAVGAAVLGSAGTALAVTGSTTGNNISGCVSGSNRALTNVHQSASVNCLHGFALTWNKQGPKGATGAQGPKGAPGAQGQPGTPGQNGKDGKDGFAGAVYRVENYPNGIGPGGVATVACADDEATSQQFFAISGGVQVNPGNDMSKTAQSLPIAASFPGRMDWSTNTPKAGRVDGWIIQTEVGYNANDTSASVWALCVPIADAGGSAPPIQVGS